MSFENREEVLQTIEDGPNADSRAGLQDDDPCAHRGRKTGYLPEVMVERDKCSAFARTYLEQLLVCRSAESLIPDGHRVVASGAQKVQAPAADVFIELELHAYSAADIGTKRSRDASAP